MRKIKKYFWEVDIKRLNFEKYKEYIIERILEYGDEEAIKWLFKKYDKKTIKKIAFFSRSLMKKSKNFWKKILNENI